VDCRLLASVGWKEGASTVNYIYRGSEEEHIPLLTLWDYRMSQRLLSRRRGTT
jgi:hypothetical protein